MIHVEVLCLQDLTNCVVSFIYGHNSHILRRGLWESLRNLSIPLIDIPWLVLGDFNVIRREEDRLGGDLSWPSYIDEFNDCCQASILDDLRSIERHLTWTRGS